MLVTLLLASATAGATTIFVDPATGSDGNTGTVPDQPLASLSAALRSLRKLKGPAAILLAGKLFLNETLTFPQTARDVTVTQWPGKPPAVVSGGVELPSAAWTRAANDAVWSAPLSAAAATALSYTSAGSIFVGGIRRHIVRTKTLRWKAAIGDKGSAASRSGFVVGDGVLNSSWSLSPASLAQWRVAAYHSWTKAFHTVKSIAVTTGTIL